MRPAAAAAQIDPTPTPTPSPAALAKSRLKRLFERQVLRVSPLPSGDKDDLLLVEPSSVCLDGMVRSFLEDGGGGVAERAAAGGTRCCNCFNGGDASDDDDYDGPAAAEASAISDAAETIKGLVHCASLRERNLLADVSTLVERHRAAGARKRDLLRLLAASLLANTGHDAALCVSRWDKSAAHPAGEHAYVDVLLPPGSERGDRERVIVDVDFRAQFEVARPTKAYRAVLQRLPAVFVGREDRLRLLVAAAADSARASLKKRGLHLPPWRKPEYMRAKWLSPYERESPPTAEAPVSELAADVGEGGGAGPGHTV